jgi:hypothetical protein
LLKERHIALSAPLAFPGVRPSFAAEMRTSEPTYQVANAAGRSDRNAEGGALLLVYILHATRGNRSPTRRATLIKKGFLRRCQRACSYRAGDSQRA